MATGTNGAKASEQEEQEERRPTERVILKRIKALAIPEEATPEQITQAVEALRAGKRGRSRLAECDAWIEVARKEGSKKAAIEAYTGKAGTADAEVGAFKAPSSTAWKGGLVLEAPPQPLVTARELDE